MTPGLVSGSLAMKPMVSVENPGRGPGTRMGWRALVAMNPRFTLLLRRAGFALALLAALAATSAAQERVIAVGDVHGAYPEFVAILQRIGLINSDRQWTGGSNVLVQTGDISDRGARTRECLDLLMELERQSEKQNGRVVPLLGNHEVMNIMGDLRYVSPEEYGAFVTEQSEKVREQAFQDYRKFLAARNSRRRQPPVPDDEASRQKWMAEHPLGYFEHRDAYGPQGQYGRWLRKHDAVAQVGDVIFLHGGLNPKLRFKNIAELNNRTRSELANFDSLWQSLSDKKIIWRYMRLEEAIREAQDEVAEIQSRGGLGDFDTPQKIEKLLGFQSWLVVSPDGPLWYRGYAQQPEEKLKGDLEGMLARLKAKRVVVGHSPTATHRITPRFDNKVFLIDTGMLYGYFRGQASALEIQNGRFTGYYLDGEQQVLLAPPASGSVPALSRSQSGNRAP